MKGKRVSQIVGLLIVCLLAYAIFGDFLSSVKMKEGSLGNVRTNFQNHTEHSLENGLVRQVSVTGLPTGVTAPTTFGDWSGTPGAFENLTDLPASSQKALNDAIIARLGRDAFAQLGFVGAVRLDPPISGLQFGFDRKVPSLPVALIATFVAENAIPGVRTYEGLVALNDADILVEIEFPMIERGVFEDNFISPRNLILKAGQSGYSTLPQGHWQDGRVKYSDARILVTVSTLPYLDYFSFDYFSLNPSVYRFKTVDYDLQTGQRVGKPKLQTREFSHFNPIIKYNTQARSGQEAEKQ